MIIGFANIKGNVGKTTSTIMLGELLAKNGKKVLLIDGDSQSSLSLKLSIENLDQDDKTTYEYFSSNIESKKVIKKLDKYDLMPSKIELMNLSSEMTKEEASDIIKVKLNKLREEYDYILVDFPPDLDYLTLNISKFAEKIMIITDTGNISKIRALETMKRMQSSVDEKINFAGVIVTKFTEEVDHMDEFNDLPIYKIEECKEDALVEEYKQILKDIL